MSNESPYGLGAPGKSGILGKNIITMGVLSSLVGGRKKSGMLSQGIGNVTGLLRQYAKHEEHQTLKRQAAEKHEDLRRQTDETRVRHAKDLLGEMEPGTAGTHVEISDRGVTVKGRARKKAASEPPTGMRLPHEGGVADEIRKQEAAKRILPDNPEALNQPLSAQRKRRKRRG